MRDRDLASKSQHHRAFKSCVVIHGDWQSERKSIGVCTTDWLPLSGVAEKWLIENAEIFRFRKRCKSWSRDDFLSREVAGAKLKTASKMPICYICAFTYVGSWLNMVYWNELHRD